MFSIMLKWTSFILAALIHFLKGVLSGALDICDSRIIQILLLAIVVVFALTPAQAVPFLTMSGFVDTLVMPIGAVVWAKAGAVIATGAIGGMAVINGVGNVYSRIAAYRAGKNADASPIEPELAPV